MSLFSLPDSHTTIEKRKSVILVKVCTKLPANHPKSLQYSRGGFSLPFNVIPTRSSIFLRSSEITPRRLQIGRKLHVGIRGEGQKRLRLIVIPLHQLQRIPRQTAP